MNSSKFAIENIGGYQIVRDDLFEGGTKRRAFERMLNNIEENEFVYACDYYGHAAYAIALTALGVEKKVTLFYLSPKVDTDIFKKTTNLPNVTYHIVDNAPTQIEASKTAIAYSEKSGARFFPIGLDFSEFGKELEIVVKSANINAPEI